jgi:single-strand DNA-binding protein
MNDAQTTICGNLVDEPRMRQTKNGHLVTNFRVASTARRYDREQGRFVDSGTLYITVSAWRGMGENVAASLHKGHPVVVTGWLRMHEYRVEEQVRTAYEIEATAVGHDLARGTSQFTRVSRGTPAVSIVRDENGLPADDSDRWHDVEPSAMPADPFGEAPAATADALDLDAQLASAS